MNKVRKIIFEKFHVWDIWDLLPYRWSMLYYDKIKPIFKPRQERLRKSIPRTWCDTSELVVDLNFEMIKIFYEDEYMAGIVDWQSDDTHKEFASWLENAYEYITKLRPKFKEDLENSYPPLKPIEEWLKPKTDENGRKFYEMIDDGVPYEVKYAEVNRIEKLIYEKDTEVITEMVKRRGFFWT